VNNKEIIMNILKFSLAPKNPSKSSKVYAGLQLVIPGIDARDDLA
jgi:gentisate 1,2-dioxygenase